VTPSKQVGSLAFFKHFFRFFLFLIFLQSLAATSSATDRPNRPSAPAKIVASAPRRERPALRRRVRASKRSASMAGPPPARVRWLVLVSSAAQHTMHLRPLHAFRVP
jgi:hypothetical protein